MKRYLLAAVALGLTGLGGALLSGVVPAAAQWVGQFVGVVDSTGVQFSSNHNFPMVIGQRTLIALDVSSVTTGGTAVNALIAGHKTAGGWIQNPVGASAALCINEIGVASGTTSSGSTTCIAAGGTYLLTPSAGAVSVISSDSSHAFSGQGFN